jgi:hypothetical protein
MASIASSSAPMELLGRVQRYGIAAFKDRF